MDGRIVGLAGQEKPSRATLELRRGEVVGIAGLMGSGRTELIRAIFGLDQVARGEITVMKYSGAASPQQRLGNAKAPADVWALGATLFFLLTGQDALGGLTHPELAVRATSEPFPSITSHRTDLPDPRKCGQFPVKETR